MKTKSTKRKRTAARVAAVAAGSAAPAGPQEWMEMYTNLAVMASGKRRYLANYLRQTADALDKGMIAGFTGDANPVKGEWFANR